MKRFSTDLMVGKPGVVEGIDPGRILRDESAANTMQSTWIPRSNRLL